MNEHRICNRIPNRQRNVNWNRLADLPDIERDEDWVHPYDELIVLLTKDITTTLWDMPDTPIND